MGMREMFQQFVTGAKQQQGNNFNPQGPAQNLFSLKMGCSCNTPQEALQLILQSGRINQAQYNEFLKML